MTLELVPWNKTSSERVTENGLNCLSPWVCSPRPAMSGDLAVQCSKLIEWYHRSDFCFPNEFVLPLVYIYTYIIILVLPIICVTYVTTASNTNDIHRAPHGWRQVACATSDTGGRFHHKICGFGSKATKKNTKRLALQFGKHFPEILELQCEI